MVKRLNFQKLLAVARNQKVEKCLEKVYKSLVSFGFPLGFLIRVSGLEILSRQLNQVLQKAMRTRCEEQMPLGQNPGTRTSQEPFSRRAPVIITKKVPEIGFDPQPNARNPFSLLKVLISQLSDQNQKHANKTTKQPIESAPDEYFGYVWFLHNIFSNDLYPLDES